LIGRGTAVRFVTTNADGASLGTLPNIGAY
jgi:hypothetical protein